MDQVRWGIIGPGAIAGNFAQGLAECDSGRLEAIASRSPERRAAFGHRFGVGLRFDSYAALIASDAVDAIYIATPHPTHAQLSIDALRAGKHVLCEKPAGLVAGEVVAVTEVAAQEGRFFMEGLMYRCHPQIARVVEMIQAGEIGAVRHISAQFGFAAGYDPASRLYDPALAGGAILDVGLYPVSFARLIAGAAQGLPFAEPLQVAGTGALTKDGVDETAFCSLLFEGGVTAELGTAISLAMENTATIIGTKGQIHLPDPWMPGRDAGPSDAVIVIRRDGEECPQGREEHIKDPCILFAHEAELASSAILAGQTQAPAPAPSWADSIGTARVVDAWRAQAGYTLPAETPKGLRRIAGSMPAARPEMPMARIAGLDRDVSKLIIGCDNRDTLAEGAIVWDAWIEAGGNAFDTGFVYGGGRHEAVLGDWIATRGLAKEVVVIAKGAHTPYCTPRAIAAQLEISLERLQLDHAPIYIMHRDNLDVPVGEFMDALNALQAKGLIGAIGGSNWSVARFQEANAYAAANGLNPLTILNNNLSLARMEQPVWPGCISSNDPTTLGFLRDSGTAHLSWSSQARGYFFDVGTRTELPEDTNPDTCFASAGNAERRRRATALASERGVEPFQVAAAWVLEQSFPSFALIGPRSPGEIATTLPALAVSLSPREIAWLNLDTETL
ncbi:putative oxidoreductase [Candidatus Rhodobacter oscarellae]|uniref:Putative oxidoreductase n=1 Tax=Candidatus Rhodobacter oscarellae TaxID=1675527 RepID=A0A0J9H1E3_9RHOB|nr:aldo/keto reductase [Candidatus Rhodobacter lobularis]KMW59563.1 putative oxidoreductase [Candidatus Rhodobacter lobularis]